MAAAVRANSSIVQQAANMEAQRRDSSTSMPNGLRNKATEHLRSIGGPCKILPYSFETEMALRNALAWHLRNDIRASKIRSLVPHEDLNHVASMLLQGATHHQALRELAIRALMFVMQHS